MASDAPASYRTIKRTSGGILWGGLEARRNATVMDVPCERPLPSRIPNPTIKGSVGNLEIVRASVSSIIPFVKLRGTLKLWVLLFVRLVQLL